MRTTTPAPLPCTPTTELAWRQGDTAHLIGNSSSANPYEPILASVAYEAWKRGYFGHPYDERGGFTE
jgi:hypothetical protein